MAISLKHNFTSAVADEGDTSLVRPSNWNAEHDLTLATARLLGRTTAGTGSAEEISVGTGLNLSSGSLAVSSTTPQVNSINTFTASQVISVTDNSNPALRITQLGTADALLIEDETNPDATPFAITADGHAIAGATAAATIDSVVPQFQSHTTVATEGGYGGVDWGNTSTGQINWFAKSRGGSFNSQAIVQSGDTIGDFRFYGSDGVGFIPAAKIEVDVDGTPGVNDMPGRMSFFTTADGAATSTERFRIGNAGQWGIGGATYGTSGQAFLSGGASAAPTWGTLGIAGGGTGQTTAPAAINALTGYLATVGTGGSVTLTNASPQVIYNTGGSVQTIILPDVTTLQLGWSFIIINGATAGITVQSSGLNSFANTITAGLTARLTCIAVTGTTAASWAMTFEGATGRTGTGSIVYSSSPTIGTPTIAQVNGGTAVSSTLTLQSTTGAGTTDAIILRTGSQSERFRVGTAGQFGIGGANYGTSTQYMKSGGASAAPSWASISNTDISGLGTMSTQNSDSVSITGGSITGITDLAVADGGTGASTLTGYVKGNGTAAMTASATIPNTDISGLGTMSTQSASSVSITGGSITGITDLAVADGGTGASSFTAYSVVLGGTTSTGPLQNVSGLGTSGQVLTSGGAGAAPSWTTVSATASGTLIRAPQILTSGTSYTTPAGCNTIYVELVGGGGGSGGIGTGADNIQTGTGGGGAGAYAAKYFTVTPSTSYTYAIGAGGSAGAATPTNGGTGGSTTFTVSATTVTAAGGSGSSSGGGNVSAGGAGGAGTNGDINIRGAGGVSGSGSNSGSSGFVGATSGAGGNSFFGGGGQGRLRITNGVTVGAAGESGGGASGSALQTGTSSESGTGAAGGAGLIRITEYT